MYARHYGDILTDPHIVTHNSISFERQIFQRRSCLFPNLLVDEGTVFKKRGLGMYVSPDAPENLKKRLSRSFFQDQIEPLTALAKPLGFSLQEIHEMIDSAWKGEKND